MNEFEWIWCASVEDVEIPSKSSAFLTIKDWKTKIRFLQGPVLSYVSQEWWDDHKPVWEKIRYKYDDPEVKKDKDAKLVMTYLVYSYDTNEIKVWEIATKWIQEDLKSINGLDIVNKIKVYDYKWKSDGTRMDGVLAHELQEILPYAVFGQKDGKEMQGVDYSKIVPVLTKSVQEVDTKVVALENKIVILEAELEILKNK